MTALTRSARAMLRSVDRISLAATSAGVAFGSIAALLTYLATGSEFVAGVIFTAAMNDGMRWVTDLIIRRRERGRR